MKKTSSRTIHRYLSVVIGVQLLFWTTSGLIFSWNPIKKVRGEHLIRETEPVDLSQFKLMSILDVLLQGTPESGWLPAKAELRVLLNEPVYEVTFANSVNSSTQQFIFDAVTGEKLSPVSEAQARQVAQQDFAEEAEIASAELIEAKLSSHSEYRGRELPVWRIVMDHPTGTVIYVSANRGVVTTRRNNRWRVFRLLLDDAHDGLSRPRQFQHLGASIVFDLWRRHRIERLLVMVANIADSTETKTISATTQHQQLRVSVSLAMHRMQR